METGLKKLDDVIDTLKEEVAFLRGLRHARKSEKWTEEDRKQVHLFNEIEQLAVSLLSGFSGILQTDGYAGYNKAAKKYKLYHVGCLAHASAIIYRLCETALADKIEPQDNLFQLFKQLPEIDTNNPKVLESFLHRNLKISFLCCKIGAYEG